MGGRDGDVLGPAPSPLLARLLLRMALLLPAGAGVDGKKAQRQRWRPCRNDEDCSFNGVCDPRTGGGRCVCAPGWSGAYCHRLDLLPATNGSGLDLLHGHAPPTSTWGGSVIYSNATELYHMYASEITRSCGIHRWTTNSRVIHAVSRGPADGWRFEKPSGPASVVLPVFSHEPIVTRAEDGRLVLFVTFYPNGSAADCPTCTCADGNSASGGPSCAVECGCGSDKTMFSYFTSAEGPYGPWGPLQSLCATQVSGSGNGTCKGSNVSPRTDMNLAPLILPNGTLLAWTRWDIWRSDDWRDPTHYEDIGQAPDFDTDPPTPWEGENPSMWTDANGIFHILSHNGDRGTHYRTNSSGDCGRHYYSKTGLAGSWRVAPLLPREDLGGCAYPRVNVPFEDGNNYTFYRRERPHLIFGPDGIPVALSTAVIDSPVGPESCGTDTDNKFCIGTQRDASYTLVQPINTADV